MVSAVQRALAGTLACTGPGMVGADIAADSTVDTVLAAAIASGVATAAGCALAAIALSADIVAALAVAAIVAVPVPAIMPADSAALPVAAITLSADCMAALAVARAVVLGDMEVLAVATAVGTVELRSGPLSAVGFLLLSLALLPICQAVSAQPSSQKPETSHGIAFTRVPL